MASEDDFIARLMGFGLTEKEAKCYFYLLKYGPKTPSPLAKSLQTYREDIHRTINSLIDKGMVRPSLDSPTLYTAVELETALEAALKKHESELRELEARKRKLEELSRQQQFGPSDETGTFTVLKTIKDIVNTAAHIIQSTEKEFLCVIREEGLLAASMFGVDSLVKDLTERGGKTRGISHITYSAIPFVQELVAIGVDARHLDNYDGLYYGVFDRKYCMSAININVERVRLDEPATMFFTDDPVYAGYLVSTFELLWEQATPVEKRLQELLEQGPPKG
ncbi:MAG: TrmB family transcriptional regulator [Halobacteriota archaeon]